MLENIHANISRNIHWLNQHADQNCTFSSKKNDQLLQNLVDDLMHFSELKMCSDIHIEPQEKTIKIRLRIDGVLSEHFQLPKFIHEQLCCKFKILANMNISQTRMPQDGKFIFYFKNGLNMHIRISTCPTVRGEKIVLRLLKDNKKSLDINALGMDAKQLSLFIKSISNPYGLILITGPTGSGKTSTLYSALNYVNSNMKNIITIEDPVEINLLGINQINVSAELGFPQILRTILRQDPDIIMIGEIRDDETAQIAIQAANTGHLVFSTLHTNNCIESINRLKQMNINRKDLISCLKLIISQRLFRKKCTLCHNDMDTQCNCVDGYSGRLGVFEILDFNEALKADIMLDDYCNEKQLIQNHQFISIQQQATRYAQQKITTIDEINRVLNLSLG